MPPAKSYSCCFAESKRARSLPRKYGGRDWPRVGSPFCLESIPSEKENKKQFAHALHFIKQDFLFLHRKILMIILVLTAGVILRREIITISYVRTAAGIFLVDDIQIRGTPARTIN